MSTAETEAPATQPTRVPLCYATTIEAISVAVAMVATEPFDLLDMEVGSPTDLHIQEAQP